MPDTTPPQVPQRADFRFFHRLRVRWAEVDMQKIVFNAHYLMYFDTAVADYWRALALPYESSMHELQGDLYVRKATVEFHASARVDELIDVGMRCTRVGNSSILFTGGLFRGDQLLVSCELVYVFADPSTQTSRPVPALLRELLLGYERGDDVCQMRTGTWDELGERASVLRREVFIGEQAIPADMEWDDADAGAVHGVALNALGHAIATGRLLQGESPGLARIGRVAVHRNLRGGRWGAALMRLLEDAARARGDREIRLHAQVSARAFYERLGYAACGDVFEEAGIAHIEMSRSLH
ncbi:YbgC/FadM family acyl-CoA thioesterase [Variovorax dokdonensis]|uniref:YbgC/FadM family acyl-CoA thioesterase n=1 Tax=Variovorax dokdonensis TaxID=344883 RepID=A0ABT7NGR4_9BURK|nr:YbgC/FadM family acyl-CoA thioesterase [Variovorax dokdonensis]MDM0047129.1 YbgC/FadM family acyl-CoA thioesterase [Variovorax dokdonensis]